MIPLAPVHKLKVELLFVPAQMNKEIEGSLSEVRLRRKAEDAGLSAENLIQNSYEENSSRGKDHFEVHPQGQAFSWKRPIQRTKWYLVLLFTVLAFASRYYRINVGEFVSWDEAHFGKFASYYLKRKFYWDVHPPLGKMLVALGGYLAGYRGDFDFGSGGAYEDKVNYVAMRMFVAAFGTMIVPLSYMTAIQLRFSETAAILVGLTTLLENGFIGITRLILLDSFLLGFTTLALFSYAWFRNQNDKPFSAKWKFSMLLTGLAIGMVSSVKWVGFFITAMIGFMTIEELWNMLSDKNMDKKSFLRHFAARVIGLIVVPIAVYVFCFYLHFLILNHSGSGDANMSSLFQASLHGSSVSNSPIEVVYGSVVTMKSSVRSGGLLHSHPDTYPEGSKQQQVTTYHHKDANNYFVIVHEVKDLLKYEELETPINVKDGDIIRLQHNATGRMLHSHKIPAPLTKKDFEVTGYGRLDHHDTNDLWKVEILKDSRAGPRIIRSLTTQFRLQHVATGCYLKARNNALPKWGFSQGEVTCDRKPDLSQPYYYWNIEHNVNEKLPPAEDGAYSSNFWDNLIEINLGMYRTNNALTQDPEYEPGQLVSNAEDWFFLSRGLRMVGWGDDRPKFYMLGNPIIWWSSSATILATGAILISYILMSKRQALKISNNDFEFFKYQVKMTAGAWAMTYLPFFIMGRVLYLHHYYPALIFAILNVGFMFDHILYHRKSSTQYAVASLLVAIFAVTFIYFSPICYGIEGPAREVLRGRKWLRSWNMY